MIFKKIFILKCMIKLVCKTCNIYHYKEKRLISLLKCFRVFRTWLSFLSFKLSQEINVIFKDVNFPLNHRLEIQNMNVLQSVQNVQLYK